MMVQKRLMRIGENTHADGGHKAAALPCARSGPQAGGVWRSAGPARAGAARDAGQILA